MKTAPPEDEFDVMFRESYAFFGFMLIWVAIVRAWRAARKRWTTP